jgi:hypothetical protein
VYWVAEEYAELLGEQVTGGHLPTWAYVRAALAHTWPMVSASYLPLLALVLARLAGASASTAANVGLVAAVLLLTFHGWSAGRASHLRGWQLAGVTSVAAALGLVMVLLKDLVLIHRPWRRLLAGLAARALLHHELASHVSSLVGPAPGTRRQDGCGFPGAARAGFTPKWMQNGSPRADPGPA